MTEFEKILRDKPCYACIHFESCKVRTGAYILCKDSRHEHFEYNCNKNNSEVEE